ncbi:MAG: Fe-S cluster assembly protein NifU [Desulfobacteraceae bacterium]|jgi:NifU-like protein|nr:MAG: Fe-S cluster assembly protein NifU [Desulfobacteraceae bacterium]
MWEYTDKVKDHFLNPRNVGEIKNPDGVGEVGSMACGDALKLFFKLDANGRIADARFQTFGCASAIASSSALTEMLKGKTLEEAEKITNEDIAAYLGGLPKEKMHCSVLGRDALKKAVMNYRGEAPVASDGEVVCECFGVTDRQIEKAVRDNNLKTVEDITNYTKAGGGCGNCHERIREIINEVNLSAAPAPAVPQKMTNIEKIKRVEETLEREIKPALRKDGGSIELVDVDGNTVYVRLTGTCAVCAASELTLKNYVESTLREFVTPELTVEEVRS